MRVVALEMGFRNGHRIRPGKDFEVDEGETAPWFAPIESEAAQQTLARISTASRPPEPTTLKELGEASASITGLDHARRLKNSSAGATGLWDKKSEAAAQEVKTGKKSKADKAPPSGVTDIA